MMSEDAGRCPGLGVCSVTSLGKCVEGMWERLSGWGRVSLPLDLGVCPATEDCHMV